jgi:hypothetical protein
MILFFLLYIVCIFYNVYANFLIENQEIISFHDNVEILDENKIFYDIRKKIDSDLLSFEHVDTLHFSFYYNGKKCIDLIKIAIKNKIFPLYVLNEIPNNISKNILIITKDYQDNVGYSDYLLCTYEGDIYIFENKKK